MASDPREYAGLGRHAPSLRPVELGLRWSRIGELAGGCVLLAAHGSGCANAGRAVEVAYERLPVRAVVSTGWCGALDPALSPGALVVADRVLSLEPPREFAACWPSAAGLARGPVLTVDHFVQTAEEKARLRSTRAVAVEMEAAGVADEAHKRGLPFFCVRAVSDTADESARIDFNRARLADGRFSVARILLEAGLRPARWRELAGLWRGARLASKALGEFLASCQFQS